MDDLRHIWPEMHERHARQPFCCAVCGQPATCVGIYEDPNDLPLPACDDCCGHGGEDGLCEPLGSDNDATGVKGE